MNPAIKNPYNMFLETRRQALGKAVRFALAPICNPTTGQPNLTPAQMRKQLLNAPITAAIAGDNYLIPTLAGKKLIYEVVLWNASAAAINMTFYQGPSATGVLLMPISNFPATTGLTLGFNGNWEMPHWEVDNGQPLVVNLSTTGPLQGFIRYRIQNGTQ
jgi:hypothetical protein